jgi:hypothetical protein
MKSKCELVRTGEVKRKGKVADKIIRHDKTFYSCYGYRDAMTDEPLEECQRCKLWYRQYW